MLKNYLELLIRFHTKKQSMPFKYFSLLVGGIFFLFILPAFFYYLAILTGVVFDVAPIIKIPLSILTAGLGLFFLIWATYSQLKIGLGTPAPNAPTQKLVIIGPYKYTRNPIEFGAILYYFGFGTLWGSLYHGLVCMFLGFLFGSVYHKFVEEKELLLRFGKEYADYRRTTPFLLPRFGSRKR